jgi:hypothetical protein
MLNNMPAGQVNAHLPKDEFVMRVGVPHRSGSLAFHAFEKEYPVMVSAAAFWLNDKQRFHMPEATDLTESDWALDSAGFSAVQNWGRKGKQRGMAGVYPWTVGEYLEFASLANPSWFSQPDLCCEIELASNRQEVDYRIRATATLLESLLRTLYEWQNELARTCNATTVSNMLRPCVPVIQGRTIADYRMSMELMLAVWERWQPWLAPPTLIGIGSMCRRDVSDPEQGLLAILDGVKDYVPEGSKLHVFGAKGTALTHLAKMGFVAGSDSMAFDFSTRMSACKAGVPNSMERRKSGMTEWMESARARISLGLEHHDLLLTA